MTIFRFNIVLVAAVVLSGCSEKISEEGLICNQSPGFISSGGTTADGQIDVTKMCIHKWAYRLGRAPGSNGEIADAVIGACREAVDHVLELRIAESARSGEPYGDELWQLQEKRFGEDALYRVVQGRAGNCSIRGIDQK